MRTDKTPDRSSEVRSSIPRLACSVDEAAESTGLSRSTLYLEMAAGNLNFLKCGKRRLIPMAGLEAFLTRLGGVA